MPNLGTPEILVIFVVALLVFGPHKLPEIGRQVGRGMRELKKFQGTLKREIRDTLDITGGAFGNSSNDPPTLPAKVVEASPAQPTLSLTKSDDVGAPSHLEETTIVEADPAAGRRAGSTAQRSQSLTPVERPVFDETPDADPASGRGVRAPQPASPSSPDEEAVEPPVEPSTAAE